MHHVYVVDKTPKGDYSESETYILLYEKGVMGGGVFLYWWA